MSTFTAYLTHIQNYLLLLKEGEEQEEAQRNENALHIFQCTNVKCD